METEELKTLAEFMHKHNCGLDHTERCGWGYEIKGGPLSYNRVHDWRQPEHKDWLRRAKKVVANMSEKRQANLLIDIKNYSSLCYRLKYTYKVI